MKSNIFLPKTIRVGYQKRSDTYTGSLAYVIYIDAKGKVRKEASWNSWRDKKIDANDYTNEPTSGFVLNRKAGGYSTGWNHRQTYCRVYDPRGFEFEITIPNLLYILENTSAIKGKGLEGEFVYGWDGTDLILMPVAAPDYAQLTEFAESTFNKESITSKNIVLGGTYRTNKNEDWIYLGRFDEWEKGSTWYGTHKPAKNKGKRYWFQTEHGIETVTSLSAKLIKTVDANPVANYAELMDEVEQMERYSPYDPTADKIIKVSLETLRTITETVKNETSWGKYYIDPEVCFTVNGIELVSTLKTHRNKEPLTYYLSTPYRRIPLPDDKFEYKVVSSSYYRSNDDGWEYDYDYDNGMGRRNRYYGDQRYKRDTELHEARKLVKPYANDGYNGSKRFTLEELEDKFGFSLRRKFLQNGKLLKMEYDDALEFSIVYTEDEEDTYMEAVNG